MSNDEEFETLLRRFQPLPPAPLLRATPRAPRALWLTAAALLLFGAGLWLRPRPIQPVGRVMAPASRATWRVLSATALVAPAALNAELEQQAREGLPDVRRRGGALHSLAQTQKDL